MNYLKYTQYVYLLVAVFFIYRAAELWGKDNDQGWLFLAIGVVSIFMFLFRRRFAKKFEDHSKRKP